MLWTLLCLFATGAVAQNHQSYYVEMEPGQQLGTIQKTVNQNQTLTLGMANSNFAQYLNALPVYYFEKAFPTAVTPALQRVYKITVPNGTSLSGLVARAEVKKNRTYRR